MSILYIISSNAQHREILEGHADWRQLHFTSIRHYESLRHIPRGKSANESLLILLDTERIDAEDCRILKEIRRRDAIAQIILFSDTTDYETLSNALDLRVLALISWKDFSQKKFADTLGNFLGEIDERVHQEGIVKRQLLRDILKGKKPTSEDVYRYFGIDDAYASYVAFYIRRDEPVRIVSQYERSREYYAVNWHGNPFQNDLEYIATVDLFMNSWCMLLRVKRLPSTMNLFNLCWKTASMLQQSFNVQVDDTVSIAFSDIFQGFDNLTGQVEMLQQILDLQNYNGRARIASYRDPLPVFTDPQEFMNIWRPRLSQSLYENNADGACDNIERLFTQLKQSQYARANCLEAVCRQLVEDIDNFCRSYAIPTIEEMSLSSGGRPPCYKLQDVIGTFKLIVRRVLSMMEENSIESADNDKINEIIKYVENNCETATVATVAEHFRMSADYLSHYFKSKTGRNLSTLITEKKVNRAKGLLRQGKYKIKEVAEMVGFNSSQYFSTVFVKVVGMNPKEYIESQKQ